MNEWFDYDDIDDVGPVTLLVVIAAALGYAVFDEVRHKLTQLWRLLGYIGRP